MIYTNEVPGDYTTKLNKVGELPEQYQLLSDHVQSLREIITKGNEARRELNEIIKNCRHEYFHDEGGWMYDTRMCEICGTIADFI